MSDYIILNGELYHYGVKGMKWGIRRYQNEDGTLTSLGKTRREYRYQSKAERFAKSLPTLPIDIIKSAPMTVVNSFLPYGVSLHSDKIVSAVRGVIANIDRKNTAKNAENLSNINKKTKNETVYEDLEKINPGYGIRYGRSQNCGNCSIAMEMRRRGYDVQATRNDAGILTEQELPKWFANPKFKKAGVSRNKGESYSDYSKRSFESLCSELESQGDGARGIVTVKYTRKSLIGKKKYIGGHAMFYENSNGKTRIYDGQRNKVDPYDVFSAADPEDHGYCRLDNLKVLPGVTEMVQNRKK